MFRENRNRISAISLLITLALVLASAAPASAQYQLKKPGGQTPASITVTYPNGGEVLEKGSRIKITWQSTGIRGSVKIVLIDGSGETTEIAKRASNRGTYSYTVSSRLEDGQYKVAVMSADESTRDESDAVFTIQKKTFGAKDATRGTVSEPSAPAAPTGLKPTGDLKTATGTTTGLQPATGVQGTVGQTGGDEEDGPAFGTAGNVAGAVSGTTPSVSGSTTTVTNELVNRGTITTVRPSAAVVREIEATISVGAIAQPESNVHGTNIAPHVWFDSPAAGDEWAPGSQQTIEWEGYNIEGSVQIALLKGDERFVILPNASGTGNYTYTVPHNVGMGHDKYRLEAVVSSQEVTNHSSYFSIYEPQPVDLACSIVNLKTKRKSINAWIFYEKKERWISFDLTVTNNGTAGPIVAPLLWRMVKLPENIVVLQEEGAFGDVYPGAWYITASPLEYKIREYERIYIVPDNSVNFDAGNYRLEVFVDYNNTLNEHADLREDNVYTAEIFIEAGR